MIFSHITALEFHSRERIPPSVSTMEWMRSYGSRKYVSHMPLELSMPQELT